MRLLALVNNYFFNFSTPKLQCKYIAKFDYKFAITVKMILNITTTHKPATDLGYLLHKHPDKFQTLELSFGKAHVFYPEKSEEKATVSVLLDIDPIDMVRGARNLGGDGFALVGVGSNFPVRRFQGIQSQDMLGNQYQIKGGQAIQRVGVIHRF